MNRVELCVPKVVLMRGWQITEPGKIGEINKIESLSGVDSVKIKLTRTLITEEDIAIFAGDEKSVKLPIIPGRAAVGQITELGQPSPYLGKGTRVFLSPVKPCGECYHCANDKHGKCYNFSVAGRTTDGFLKDFVVLDSDNVYPLPQNVKDDDAVYIDYIMLAISAIDKLQIEKGEHVAVFGSSVLGSIIAQLIIYYQGVPILIGNDENELLLAKKSGIYYAIKTSQKTEKEISSFTSGRMAEKVIYLTRSGITVESALKAAAPFSKVAFAGYSAPNLKVPFGLAMTKQLTNICVTNGYGNAEAAINILSNKAIDLSNYKLPVMKMESIEKEMTARLELFNEKKLVPGLLLNMLG